MGGRKALLPASLHQRGTTHPPQFPFLIAKGALDAAQIHRPVMPIRMNSPVAAVIASRFGWLTLRCGRYSLTRMSLSPLASSSEEDCSGLPPLRLVCSSCVVVFFFTFSCRTFRRPEKTLRSGASSFPELHDVFGSFVVPLVLLSYGYIYFLPGGYPGSTPRRT